MYKLFILVVVALLAGDTMSFRIRRQSDTVPRQVSTELKATSTTVTPSTTLSNSAQSIVTQQCIKDCPTTPEYNPVCGSNGQLYQNPGYLLCAQMCGVNVTQLRPAPCPLN